MRKIEKVWKVVLVLTSGNTLDKTLSIIYTAIDYYTSEYKSYII